MSLGISDLKRVITLPGNWDLAYLRRFIGLNGSKVDFAALALEMGAAFTAFNASLTSGYIGRFLRITSDPTTEYASGNGNQRLPRISEHAKADPIVGGSSGHMLPMYDFGGALGWTYWALRRSPMSKFTYDLSAVVEASYNSWEYEFYNRLFSSKVATVGAQGKSLPFMDGGVADPTYVPPSVKGKVFTSAENRYRRYTDDSAGRIQMVTEAARSLRDSGFAGPYDLVVPDQDLTKWQALNDPAAKWIKPGRVELMIVNGFETRASIDEEIYRGSIETPDGLFQVYATPRVSPGVAHASKPLGFDNTKNPIAVRFEPGYALGLSVVAEIKHYPFEEAQIVFTFGDGVNNRMNGFNARFAAAGNYADPDIN